MKHEIIVSVYDYGYGFSMMVDERYNDNPNVKRKCPDHAYEGALDEFISYIAELYEWNTGDVARIVWCEDGYIEVETTTVR